MTNTRNHKKRLSYIPVPDCFIRASDIATTLEGHKNRKVYLESLAEVIMKNQKKLKKDERIIEKKNEREFIEFPW